MTLTIRSLSTILLLSTSLTLTVAQSGSLLPSLLPACATTCVALQQAATGCVPPAAPVTNQDTYQSCFCQSALLTSLQQNPSANICAPQCSDADFATIDVWYRQVCPAGGGGGGGQTTMVTITTTAAGAETPNPTTVGNDPPSSAATSGGDRSDEAVLGNGQAWFASHTRWVIMLIVLVVGFIALAIIGTWLHRRYRRKREEAENAFPRPTMQAWAPHQANVHDVGNFGKEVEAGAG
ncbi:hypothetical protein MMC30_008300, partial [Trapelia coarctata]|nr:hypothetical protein [Trapelia coarctata]